MNRRLVCAWKRVIDEDPRRNPRSSQSGEPIRRLCRQNMNNHETRWSISTEVWERCPDQLQPKEKIEEDWKRNMITLSETFILTLVQMLRKNWSKFMLNKSHAFHFGCCCFWWFRLIVQYCNNLRRIRFNHNINGSSKKMFSPFDWTNVCMNLPKSNLDAECDSIFLSSYIYFRGECVWHTRNVPFW